MVFSGNEIGELEAIPDFSNPITLTAAKKLPPFSFDSNEDSSNLFKRAPIELENGAVYSGYWNQ